MSLHAWQSLQAPRFASLLAEAAAIDPTSAADLERLRRHWPGDVAWCAVELAIARRKAAGKFDRAATLMADVPGVEQATSDDVAAHKARRFADAGVERVLDLCSGIGGDAMALSRVAHVAAVDRDPVRAWMTRFNCEGRCAAVAADATRLHVKAMLDSRAWAFHIDPDRRPGGLRSFRIEDATPGPTFLRRLLMRDQSGCGGAMKLPPGVDFAELPEAGAGEVEIISRRGRLVQAVLWSGRLQRHERSATRFPGAQTLAGTPGAPAATPPDAVLFTVDPAAERAELLHVLAERHGLAAAEHPALGLLTGPRPIDDPWLTPFKLIERLPYRIRKLQGWLVAHDAGPIEVKTRGGVVNPDDVQRQLRRASATGATSYTLFILRVHRRVEAWVTHRG